MTDDSKLSRLNIEYNQLQQQEDRLHALLVRLQQEAAALQEAIDVCTGGETATANPQETQALLRLQQVLFASDDDEEEDQDESSVDRQAPNGREAG